MEKKRTILHNKCFLAKTSRSKSTRLNERRRPPHTDASSVASSAKKHSTETPADCRQHLSFVQLAGPESSKKRVLKLRSITEQISGTPSFLNDIASVDPDLAVSISAQLASTIRPPPRHVAEIAEIEVGSVAIACHSAGRRDSVIAVVTGSTLRLPNWLPIPVSKVIVDARPSLDGSSQRLGRI